MSMDKQQVTPATKKEQESDEKTKMDIEGYLFYLLLISIIGILPIASTIWILRAANSVN